MLSSSSRGANKAEAGAGAGKLWKGTHTSLAGLAMSEKAGIDILAVWERREERIQR
jgi:hypothetical protein